MKTSDILRPLRFVALSVVALLAGCSVFQTAPSPVEPKDVSAQADLVLTGTGVQKFQCSSDKDGYWWRFIAPEAVLTDKAGRKIAYQGADFNFTAPDKSKLASKIVSSSAGKTKNDLKDVLFAVSPAGKVKKGTLTPYRWVKRDEATGGMPTSVCNRASLGSLLVVRFTARYTFYKTKTAPKK